MVVLSIASQSKLSKRRQASVLEAAQSEKQVSRMVPDRSQSFSQTKINGYNIYPVLPYSRKLDACRKESNMI
jgi:hypothetical protein